VIARAVLENPDNLLRPGLLMEVELRGAPRTALLVPEESLLSRASEHYVWQLQGETAQRVPITIGSRIPGWVEVTGGLEAGDRVVQDGVGRLSGEVAAVVVVEG
jgi:membrane fusion protein (multidrug efflux system)